jgi:hypothetical protein
LELNVAEPLETDAILTEHPLDTVQNEDLPEKERNIMDRSIVLAPYNSMVKLDDTIDNDDDGIMFEPRAVKFGRNVRELNRVFEQNNNADLDNGIINEAIQDHSEYNLSTDSLEAEFLESVDEQLPAIPFTEHISVKVDEELLDSLAGLLEISKAHLRQQVVSGKPGYLYATYHLLQ